MYFSTVLFLLLIPILIQSQPISQRGELISFDYEYSEETENFLRRVTRGFKMTVEGHLKMMISYIIPSKTDRESNSKFNFKIT